MFVAQLRGAKIVRGEDKLLCPLGPEDYGLAEDALGDMAEATATNDIGGYLAALSLDTTRDAAKANLVVYEATAPESAGG